MIMNISIILFNIILILLGIRKIKGENAYIKERKRYYIEKFKYILVLTNIFNIIANLISIYFNIEDKELDIIRIVTFAISVISFGLLLIRKNNKYKYINKSKIDGLDLMVVVFLSSLISIFDYFYVDPVYSIFYLICILSGILLITLFYIDNKEHVVFKAKIDEHYIKDINFYFKLEINKIFNYILYITAYIVFAFIEFKYVYIFYIAVFLILLYSIYKKGKKISSLEKKVYNAVTINKEPPGIVYAFEAVKDVLLLKRLVAGTIFYLFSILLLYGIGEAAFGLMSVTAYFVLLYMYLRDKVYLIKYTDALDENVIDKKRYNLKENKKISYIDHIKIFNINIYKLIIVDSLIYESNIITYDPEVVIKDIDIRINKSNIEDYILLEEYLYK